MELNLEENNEAVAAPEAKAPVRRRASRRVSAAAGTAGDVTVTTTEAPAAAEAPAAEAPAAVETPVAETPGAEATAAPATRTTAARKTAAAKKAAAEAAAETASAEAPAAETAAADTAAEAPAKAAPKRASRARKKVEPTDAPAEGADAAVAETTEAAPAEAAVDVEAPVAAPKKRVSRARKSQAAAAEETAVEAAPAGEAQADASADASTAPQADANSQAPAAESAETTTGRRSRRRTSAAAAPAEGAEKTEGDDAQQSAGENGQENKGGQTRGRGRGNRQQDAKTDSQESTDAAAQTDAEKSDKTDKPEQANGGNNRQENSTRSSRTRQRDRKRRGGDDLEPEIAEDDVLLPIAGILDVLDNYAFVRTAGYLPGVSDVYVALGQVKKYGLRRGDAVVGAIRQPRENDNSGRQKYNAIVKIESVNGKPAEESEKRPEIVELTPVFPEQPLRFGTGKAGSIGHAIDQHAPMGLGQRALVTFPASVTSTGVLAELAAAVTVSAPEAHLLVVQSNARPEDETYLKRNVSGEVITASFDRPAEDQVTIAELAIDRARRLVELGHDVVVLLDSLTELAQAYVQHQQGARVTAETAQALATNQIKHLLAAARNLENGGSLTIIATAHTHTGVDADKALLREITPVVNSFVKISGSRQAPEVNAEKSYTISF